MAGAVAGSLIFDTKTDTSGFERGTRNINGQVNSLTSSFDRLGKAMVAAFSIATIKELGGKMLEAASDLNEVQNVVDTTFEGNAKAIDEFSETALEKFGLTELSAKQFTSTIGAMFKSMGLGKKEMLVMSQSIAGLAGDMASFYNLDPEVAFEKLRSGISGETEPLKQLGINMSVANLKAFALSEGINKTYESMSQAEQATLRYQYIMQATADAQGDYVKTSDEYANQTRNLKGNITSLAAELGELLLPAMTGIVKVINKVITGITDLIKSANDGSITASIIVGILGGLLILFGGYVITMLAVNSATALWTLISGGAAVSTGALGAAFAILTSPITLIILAIGALITSIILVIKYWDELKIAAGKTWEAIKLAWSGVASWFNQTFIAPVKKAINAMLGFAEGLANGFIEAVNKIIQALNGIKISIPDWVPKIGGNEFGFDLKPLSKVRIPKLADGAVIPPNSEFLAMLGDQKSGTNIEAPLSTIEQAVDNVLSRRGGGGSGSATVILQIDGRELARATAPYNTGETRRQGVRLINGVT